MLYGIPFKRLVCLMLPRIENRGVDESCIVRWDRGIRRRSRRMRSIATREVRTVRAKFHSPKVPLPPVGWFWVSRFPPKGRLNMVLWLVGGLVGWVLVGVVFYFLGWGLDGLAFFWCRRSTVGLVNQSRHS